MKRISVVLSIVACLVACDNKPAATGTGTNTTPTGTGGTGTTPKETPKEAPKGFAYDAFKGWDAFKEGSSVTFDMDASGNKMEVTKTSDKKEAAVIHLKTSTKMAAMPDPMAGTEDVKKPEAVKAVEGNCELCKKPYKDHKDESKWSKRKEKIGDKEIEVHVMESADKTCDGKDNANKMEMWYSEEVPGHLVMMKMAAMTMKASKFEKK